MPISFGVTGFELSQHERIGHLVAMVGGPVKAAAITGRTRTTIDNMRKPGAALRLDDMLALAQAAGVSLDWVATGYEVRPELAGRATAIDLPQQSIGGPGGVAESGAPASAPGFVRLLPLQPWVARHGSASVERWTPSEFAVTAAWLHARSGLTPETARYAIADDAGMAPLIGRGAFVIVEARPAPPRSGIYLVGVGDELLARRLHRMPDGRDELVADADPAWRFPLPAEGGDKLLLHRIVWAGQDL